MTAFLSTSLLITRPELMPSGDLYKFISHIQQYLQNSTHQPLDTFVLGAKDKFSQVLLPAVQWPTTIISMGSSSHHHHTCKTASIHPLRCSACRIAHYCVHHLLLLSYQPSCSLANYPHNKACQRADWPRHREMCFSPDRLAAEQCFAPGIQVDPSGDELCSQQLCFPTHATHHHSHHQLLTPLRCSSGWGSS